VSPSGLVNRVSRPRCRRQVNESKANLSELTLEIPSLPIVNCIRRRHMKWKLEASFLNKIKNVQQNVLQQYSKMVKPGGKLVYATCSVLPSENQQQVQFFLSSDFGKDFTLVKDKKVSQAIPAFQEALKIGEQYKSAEIINKSKSMLPKLYNAVGQSHYKKGAYDKAIEEYPDKPNIYFEYGLLLEQDGKQELALKSMEKVLELDADHAEALNYIGYTWADNNINLEHALQFIQKAMELKPDNGYIQDSLGWVYFRMGDLARARLEIMKALELEPTDPHIYDHLGDIYREQGNTQKAKEAYRKAEELYPSQGEKKRIEDKINALQ